MKKNDVFTFTASNGVDVTAVVVDRIDLRVSPQYSHVIWLCYGQNRLFTYRELYNNFLPTASSFDRIVCDYAILPDYDELLARYNDLEVAQAETISGM